MTNLIQPKLWILIADAAQARVAVPDGHEGRFRTLFHFAAATNLGEHRDADKKRHAAAIAHRLSEDAARGAFDQLVLVAPGHVVHDVRDALTKQAAERVIDTDSHDLAGLSDHELSPHLAKWWLVQADPA